MDRHACYTHRSAPPPPPPPRFKQVLPFLLCRPHENLSCRAMECERVGAAKRRKERRLRSWAKHQRMTVAMALAENLHHSRQKVEGGEHDGPRAQKTARATGARPGVLTDLEPQGGRQAWSVTCLPRFLGCRVIVSMAMAVR